MEKAREREMSEMGGERAEDRAGGGAKRGFNWSKHHKLTLLKTMETGDAQGIK